MQKILSFIRHCDEEYGLINFGDKIAVGVSGGKDSLVLLKALKMYSRFCKNKFEVVGITIDMFHNSNFLKVANWCKELDIPYYIVKSNIYDVVFVDRKESSPCSLCSKMKRGTLMTKARELGCNKLALGHNADDLVHTFFLSLFYEGRLNSLLPITFMSRSNISVIRPLLLTDERLIVKEAKNLPVVESACPVNKKTKREYVKNLVNDITKDIPFAKDRIHAAIINPQRYQLFHKLKYIKSINNEEPSQKKDTD